MPLRPRDATPGIHHVWVNATGTWAYFLDDTDRITWLRLLVRTLEAYKWTCIAFCLMTTHVHIVLDVADESLPAGMQYLNREYSKDFNALHGRYGSFVRRRYGNRRIERGRDLLCAYAYVVLNPVKAGLCNDAIDWKWSSFPTTMGAVDDFPFVDASVVLAELGSSADLSLDALQEFAAHYRPPSGGAMSGI